MKYSKKLEKIAEDLLYMYKCFKGNDLFEMGVAKDYRIITRFVCDPRDAHRIPLIWVCIHNPDILPESGAHFEDNEFWLGMLGMYFFQLWQKEDWDTDAIQWQLNWGNNEHLALDDFKHSMGNWDEGEIDPYFENQGLLWFHLSLIDYAS